MEGFFNNSIYLSLFFFFSLSMYMFFTDKKHMFKKNHYVKVIKLKKNMIENPSDNEYFKNYFRLFVTAQKILFSHVHM